MFPSWYHHKIYANRTSTSQFELAAMSSQTFRFFLNLTLNVFQKPQRRNDTATPPYDGPTVASRWPWGGIRFLPCLGCLVNRTAASRRHCGGLTVPLRRPYGKLVVAATTHEGAVRSPPGLLVVTYYGFWSHESCDRLAVAVTLVTTATIARKTLRFLKITFYKP